MINQAQAHATAARWLNPEGHQGPPREVAMQEFDLGWVVWAVPPPPEVDPQTGQRRPPAEVGTACGVVDRASGELTVWPSVPVDEVVRMYQQKHGAGAAAAPTAPAEPPVTGPGNTAVATYPDPATGEETSLARVSAPGLPPAEFQLFDELQRLGVHPANVRAVHTDLRSALLPGGYPGDFILRTFPNATFSCTQGYGMRPEERAEGIAGLLQHVALMHQLAGRQPPPRPHRLPVPQRVEAAPPMRDVALGKHLVEVFGPQGVTRPDADDLATGRLPEATKNTLVWAGLPAQVPYFFTADRPDSPPAGGLFPDVATYLRETGTEAQEQTLATLAGYVRIGSDGLYTLAVQCTAAEENQNLVGTVWAVQPSSGGGRFVNRTLSAYLRSLALLVTTRRQMQGMDPYAAGTAVATFQDQIAAIDSWALDDDSNWWSLVIEQMWHGLF
ncbi:SUKH-4 family immunity protein [Streptomyces sp. Isolate_219]|uniref:SUKH-4 family immunity protein n=1 Tax=Streptomyces sp. Isolate_219 TaxID=2950110 RepID=UPI0021CA844C|nr:SUKH-4 family immunity protein [Streptomyces sp. Isolate_219]MCR8578873.1 SUKH-4 family immunity protein [Streptomyces sp. Isolate_219]